MANVLPPRFVKAANCFCVTTLGGIVQLKNKQKQEQSVSWFSTLEEAQNFYKSKNAATN